MTAGDEGRPISYLVLEPGVTVHATGGERVGTVRGVLAVPEEDVFEGIVIDTAAGRRFVAGELVASIHERGVDLRLDADEMRSLPEPEGGAGVFGVHPGTEGSPWRGILDRLTPRLDWRRRE